MHKKIISDVMGCTAGEAGGCNFPTDRCKFPKWGIFSPEFCTFGRNVSDKKMLFLTGYNLGWKIAPCHTVTVYCATIYLIALAQHQ